MKDVCFWKTNKGERMIYILKKKSIETLLITMNNVSIASRFVWVAELYRLFGQSQCNIK